MTREMRYRDAVRLLGGEEATLSALGKIAGAGILGAAVMGAPAALGLIDAKNDALEIGQWLLGKFRERARAKTHRSPTDQLVAAHNMLVLVSYWDTLKDAELPKGLKATSVKQSDIAAFVTRMWPDNDLPIPSPHQSFHETIAKIKSVHLALAARTVDIMKGLAHWDTLDETTMRATRTALANAAESATRKYEEQFRRLAADVPEFFVWASLQEHGATQGRLKELSDLLNNRRTGLANLRQYLEQLAEPNRAPTDVWNLLARRYRAELDRSVIDVDSSDVLSGLQLPTLNIGYISHSYRSIVVAPDSRAADESYWTAFPARDAIDGFLAGHLTTPAAVECPLVILGHPGSGKSLLTRVLAGQLPHDSFAIVRVALRRVSADSTIQRQIEMAVADATGESTSWPDLARAAGDALPVVVLDGYDELIQTVKEGYGDYLERAREFQQRELDVGRRVAVIVTSRTIAASRVQFPVGSIIARLEPFDSRQVAMWAALWNTANRSYFEDSGVSPCSKDLLLKHESLAKQPLLLLMLALFDADANALHSVTDLAQGQLYEHLLLQFTRREVGKLHSGLPPDERAAEVERELGRLAIVALGMLNRGKQAIDAQEVEEDLVALAGEPGEDTNWASFLVGRFFFIHESSAIADVGARRLRTYEFLHATFGEYLVSRIVFKALHEALANDRQRAESAVLPVRKLDPIDDHLLHALLSWFPFSQRSPHISFLVELCESLQQDQRDNLSAFTARLFRRSLEVRRADTLEKYAPISSSLVRRAAAYSANLTLLHTICAGTASTTSLCGSLDEWTSYTGLWEAELGDAFKNLAASLVATRTDGPLDLVLSIRRTEKESELHPLSPSWVFRAIAGEGQYDTGERLAVRASGDLGGMLARNSIRASPDVDYLMHALEPVITIPGAIAQYVEVEGLPAVSVPRVLIDLGAAQWGDDLRDSHYENAAAVIAGYARTARSDANGAAILQYMVNLFLRNLAHDIHLLHAGDIAAWVENLANFVSPAENADNFVLLTRCRASIAQRETIEFGALRKFKIDTLPELVLFAAIGRPVSAQELKLLEDRLELDRIARWPDLAAGVVRTARQVGLRQWAESSWPRLKARLPAEFELHLPKEDADFLALALQ
jgi:energy-coupling factor transporter ATP-binding protein EcfA2